MDWHIHVLTTTLHKYTLVKHVFYRTPCVPTKTEKNLFFPKLYWWKMTNYMLWKHLLCIEYFSWMFHSYITHICILYAYICGGVCSKWHFDFGSFFRVSLVSACEHEILCKIKILDQLITNNEKQIFIYCLVCQDSKKKKIGSYKNVQYKQLNIFGSINWRNNLLYVHTFWLLLILSKSRWANHPIEFSVCKWNFQWVSI